MVFLLEDVMNKHGKSATYACQLELYTSINATKLLAGNKYMFYPIQITDNLATITIPAQQINKYIYIYMK